LIGELFATQRKGTSAVMLRLFIAIVAAGLTSAAGAQPTPLDAKVTLVKTLDEGLAFSNPAIKTRGTIEPAAGFCLEIVELTLGAMPIEAEVGGFVLVAAGGSQYVPIGVGGGSDTILPLERLPLGREVGQILKSNAIVEVTRNTATSVTLDADPRATVVLLYEVPLGSVFRGLRLPDGTLLTPDL
jgi:hypothetical protein